MKNWHHIECFFQLKTKIGTKVLDTIELLEGWDKIQDEVIMFND